MFTHTRPLTVASESNLGSMTCSTSWDAATPRCRNRVNLLLHIKRRCGGVSLSPYWTTGLFTLSLRERLANLQYPQSRTFGHYPKPVTMGEVSEVDQHVNHNLCFHPQLSLHHNWPMQCLQPQSVTLLFPLTCEQDSEILELHLGQQLTLDPERAFHPFPPEHNGLSWGANFHTCCLTLG